MLWLVAIHVLGVVVAEAVPVADRMFDRKCSQPFFGINHRFHVRGVLRPDRRIRRINQVEDVCVFVGRRTGVSSEIIPAIARQFVKSVRGRVSVKRAPAIIAEPHLAGG